MINKNKIYTYLGYNPKTNILTEDIVKMVDEGIDEVNSIATKKCIFSPILPVNLGENAFVEGLELKGKDILTHLENCFGIILTAVTLGTSVDNLIRKYETTNITKAVVIESICNVIIEEVADNYEDELRTRLKQNNLFATCRYSPGYGDLPINIQQDILNILDANRKIGLTVSSSGIMIPRKSITGILGISNVHVKGKLAGCKNCVLKDKCTFIKRGISCN